MAAVVRFVDAVGSTSVRLDLSPGTGVLQVSGRTGRIDDGVDFGRPKLTAVTADGALADGDPYVASSYGNVRFALPLAMPTQASMAARQSALTALARELDRPTNVLYVHPDTGDSASISTFDTGLDGWVADSNATIVQSTAQARTGPGSLRVTATASVASTKATLNNAGTCLPGTVFQVGWGARANSTGRNTQMLINWFTAAGVYLTTTTTAALADASTGWAYTTVQVTAPATAGKYELFVEVVSASAGEQHYFDDVTVTPYDGRWLVVYRHSDAASWLRLASRFTAAETDITLDRQPFAYGASTAVTIGAASGDPEQNTYTFTLAQATGDVDAPMTLTAYVTAGPVGTPAQKFYAAVRERAYTDGPLKYVLAAPDAAITNVASTASTGAAGAGGTAYRWTPPSSAEAYVFGGAVPDFVTPPSPAAGRELIGRWRILARVKRNTGGDVFTLRARVRAGTAGSGTGALLRPDSPVTFGGTGGWTYVDLGIMQVPIMGLFGADPWGDQPAVTAQAVDLHATRVSGSGTLDTDHLIALPADGRTVIADLGGNTVNTVGDAYVVDGDRGSAYVVRDYSAARYIRAGLAPVGFDGSPLRLSPRYTSVLVVVPDAGDPGVIGSTLNLVGSYRPRYLEAM